MLIIFHFAILIFIRCIIQKFSYHIIFNKMNRSAFFFPNIKLRNYTSKFDCRLIIFNYNSKYGCTRKSIRIKIVIMYLFTHPKTRVGIMRNRITPYLCILCNDLYFVHNTVMVTIVIILRAIYVATDEIHNYIVTVAQEFITRKVKKLMRNFWMF